MQSADTHARFLAGHAVELLEGGDAYFPALAAAFDAARHEIHLQAYIFADDPAGRIVAEALVRAAARSVAVHVLVDGFGSRNMPGALRARLRAAGVELLFFRPDVTVFDFQRSRLRRLHHKIVAIDGELGFAGGINVIDDMHTPGQTPPRWDYAVKVRGPLTVEILRVARQTWDAVARTYLRRRWPETDASATAPSMAPAGPIRAAFVIRDTLRHRRDIEDAYLQAIALAEREILIASAYFLPGIEFRHALIDAARRGVQVTVLLQARVEYVLMRHASRALYRQLLDAGVRIFEYHQSFMHAKVAVIDGEWATVGSSNIDPLSLLLAREANVFVRDAAFAAELLSSLRRAMDAGARPVVAAGYRRGFAARIASWVSYGIVRVLLGWAGYGARKDYL
ncbi:MAG: cardiolipin synthase ClsB [Proteobacteria bacterium]|nr:cardiolipin synthase ClsB [Pseudomonadota bacterium]